MLLPVYKRGNKSTLLPVSRLDIQQFRKAAEVKI